KVRLLGCVGSESSSRMKLPIVVVWSLVEVKLKSRALFGTASLTIVIEPATSSLWALGVSPDRPSPEARVRLTLRTEKVVVAWMSTPPGVAELIWTEEVTPVGGHGLPATN